MKLKFLSVLLLAGSGAVAQGSWNWPEDEAKKETAEEKNVLYNDARKAGSFEESARHLEWLLENTPDLNPSLYINGVKIYKELANSNTSDQKKQYQGKVMDLYDSRIKYFNSEAEVLDRKAYDGYKFYKDDKSKYAFLFETYERAYELNGNKIGSQNLVAYMDVIRRYRLAGGELTDNDVIDRYSNVMAIIDYKIDNEEAPGKYEKIKNFVDKMLTSMVKVDCAFIVDNLGPKLEEDKSNLALAKKIIGLSLNAGCTDSDTFLEAALVLQKNEPTYGTAKIIATKYAATGNQEGAEEYFKEALGLANTNEKKGEIQYSMGIQYMQQGRKSQARSSLFRAVNSDPTLTKSYKLVGDLYMTSFKECARGESKVEDRAIFIAAFNMYKKAGDQKAMANAKEQFPSIEDIFTENFSEGDAFKVGCWINEAVKLQRRPES